MPTSILTTRIVPALTIALLAVVLLFGAKAEPADAGIDFMMGDTDCREDVNSIDASIVLQYTANLLQTVPCARNAHLNTDALITAVDATILLQYVAGLVNHLNPVPAYEGSVIAIMGDQCRGLDTGNVDYVLSDPTSGTPGQNIRVWGFLDSTTSLCNMTPVLKIVAVLPLD